MGPLVWELETTLAPNLEAVPGLEIIDAEAFHQISEPDHGEDSSPVGFQKN